MSLEFKVKKDFGGFTLDMELNAENEVLALLGASGCGKSMTLKCISGIVTPDEGRIVVNGRVLFDSEKNINLSPQARRVGLLFQNYALFPNMTVQQNLMAGLMACEKNKNAASQKIREILEKFELNGLEGHKPSELSGGQQQRVALARIFLSSPGILMLDEPFSALDGYLRWNLEQELLDVLKDTVKTEELVPGMQAEEDAAGHEEKEYDEHVWLSLRNAETLCGAITEALQQIDPEHKQAYADNAQSYINQLSQLDCQYQSTVENAARKTVLFGDRFPFRYLVDDYGLTYYAAFAGCSAESEASFETVSFLAGKVDELGLPCVLTMEGKQHKIAETIVQNTRNKAQQILTMDSMQGTTAADVQNGTSYLSIMQSNLKALQTALN